MKHFEVTKQITGNNFPSGINFKIETDFELKKSGRNRVLNLVQNFKGLQTLWENFRNSPKSYLHEIFNTVNLD
jgi:hypothetical protein